LIQSAPLLGAVEMMVSLRLKDELIAEIDRGVGAWADAERLDREHFGPFRVGACE
jgi:hypothetical protein